MNFNNALQTDMLDILFANRNKSYGAYQLRKNYHKRLFTSLLVMLGFCLVSSAVFKLQFMYQKKVPIIDLSTTEIILAKPDETKPAPVQLPKIKPLPVEPVHVATIKLSTIKLVNTDVPPPATQDDIENLKIDVATTVGVSGDDRVAPPTNAGIGTAFEAPVKKEDYNGIFTTVQQQAQFPGGADAWKRFLERNLRSGVPAENGAAAGTYTVIVSFLVNKSGTISEVKAENDPGYGTAAEAVRVIQRGPVWMPANQNGRVVSYRQKQSITFIVSDQE